jgi:hypothetical protein
MKKSSVVIFVLSNRISSDNQNIKFTLIDCSGLGDRKTFIKLSTLKVLDLRYKYVLSNQLIFKNWNFGTDFTVYVLCM